MAYYTSSRIIGVLLGGMLMFSAQTSACQAADIKDAKIASNKALSLVQEEARSVQSIDCFEVSHQIDITRTTPHYNQTTHAYVRTWVQRPGHIRAESRQYSGSETIVSDGLTTWVYDGGKKTYWKQAGGAPSALFSNAFPGLARQLSSENLPSVAISAKLMRAESLTIAGRNYLCDIVDVQVMPNASNGMLQDNTLRLWISREYKVPLKVEATFAGITPADRKKYSDVVTEFEPNLNIPASTWTFNPPVDAKAFPAKM